MENRNQDILSGLLIDEESRLSLRELCRACAVDADFIIELVNEGALEPRGAGQAHWAFTGISLRRVRTARRLRRDLGINPAGIALALDLLEEVEQLHARINQLAGAGHE
jgi:chaperone modulatory protein CbpM